MRQGSSCDSTHVGHGQKTTHVVTTHMTTHATTHMTTQALYMRELCSEWYNAQVLLSAYYKYYEYTYNYYCCYYARIIELLLDEIASAGGGGREEPMMKAGELEQHADVVVVKLEDYNVKVCGIPALVSRTPFQNDPIRPKKRKRGKSH